MVEEVKAGAGLQDEQLDVFIHAQVDGHRLLQLNTHDKLIHLSLHPQSARDRVLAFVASLNNKNINTSPSSLMNTVVASSGFKAHCETHPQQEVTHYCTHDKSFICQHCSSSSLDNNHHDGHVLLSLAEGAGVVAGEIESLTRVIEEQGKKCEDVISQCGSGLEKLDRANEEARMNVNTTCEMLHAKIESVRAATLEQLEALYMKKKRQVENMIVGHMEFKKQSSMMIQEVEKCVRGDDKSSHDIVQAGRTLVHQIQSVVDGLKENELIKTLRVIRGFQIHESFEKKAEEISERIDELFEVKESYDILFKAGDECYI